MLDIASRRRACEDTVKRTPAIAALVAAEVGEPLESTFISAQLPPLNKSDSQYPGLIRRPIEVHDSDAFALARILDSTVPSPETSPSSSGPSRGKVGVLNLASDREPGGGWRYTLSKTQEEALCYSSTLYTTLKPEWYPFPNTGPGSCAGIISPNIVVFKDTLDNDLVDLPRKEWRIVAVITVAAPCHPRLTEDGTDFADASQLHDLREKIMLILRLAASNRITKLVLGAMGCGAYGCPPSAVARELKAALAKDEFEGWFETVSFAVFASGPSGRMNFDAFTKVFSSAS
ncbi:mitochondrial chaperone BCS1 [Stagonosporopsis vannaccii]|nr:mitochondrial chaperone BCS1 [Stagonosporopsis vannaccii]